MSATKKTVGAHTVGDIAYVRRANLTVKVLLQGKWSIEILCDMRHGPVRFGQLGRTVPGASKKMLTQTLRKLEADGIVMRKDFSEIVLHVEYELHENVRDSVIALLEHLAQWGEAYVRLG
jgi:DNA-binding HxlR family transcriptional regulator